MVRVGKKRGGNTGGLVGIDWGATGSLPPLPMGLVAVGIPEEAAMAAAITHRMMTAYIPPVFGFFASNWLTERDYL